MHSSAYTCGTVTTPLRFISINYLWEVLSNLFNVRAVLSDNILVDPCGCIYGGSFHRVCFFAHLRESWKRSYFRKYLSLVTGGVTSALFLWRWYWRSLNQNYELIKISPNSTSLTTRSSVVLLQYSTMQHRKTRTRSTDDIVTVSRSWWMEAALDSHGLM